MEPNTTSQPVPPYSVLATVYDHMMSHVNYRRWTKYLLQLIRKTHIPIHRILDIGCGTGKMVNEFHRQGFTIQGCDPSTAMLGVAQTHFPELTFYRDALPFLPHTPSGHFNIALSLFDTINYLPDREALIASLETLYQKLETPGVFIFDAVSPHLCEIHFNHVVEKEVLDESYAYERYSYFDRHNLIQTNEITIFTPEGVFTETHTQRIFPFHELTEIIQNCSPFRLFKAYEEFTFQPLHESSMRGHFILVKGKEND